MTPAGIDQIRALFLAGDLTQAHAACQQFLSSDPSQPEAWHLSAQILLGLRNYDDAMCEIMTAIALRDDPSYHETQRTIEGAGLNDHAMLLQQQKRYSEAIIAVERARQLAPHRPEPYNTLGNLLMECGRLDEAIELFETAAFMVPPLRAAHSNLLLAMLHSDRFLPEQLLDAHKAWAARHTPTHGFPPPAIDPPDPDRKIRVGYVSPDFRRHPVATFILPIIRAHDRGHFEVTLYDDSDVTDPVKEKFRACGHNWVGCAGWSFEQLMSRVHGDKIDILIDLSVHSSGNRQGLFAARAAPIQMTWLGYAGSTGTQSVDYRITDHFVDPPGLTESHFTEKLLRLPDVLWCYDPPSEAPAVVEQTGRSAIRFGAATRLAKISATCLDAWCALVNQVPGATITLAADPFKDAAARRDWSGRFAERGVDDARLELLPGTSYEQYFELLNSFDIALDTFPFNGGTTACQSLWMGTPMVALAGKTSVGRVTGSVLQVIGLKDLIGDSIEQWLELNVLLAAESARRRELRQSLRDRMLHSPLCDAQTFTQNLEAAFRRVFVQTILRG